MTVTDKGCIRRIDVVIYNNIIPSKGRQRIIDSLNPIMLDIKNLLIEMGI